MSENKILTQEELAKVEAEVKKQQAEALNIKAGEQAKEIEAKVRREMEAQLETERLRESLKKQEEELAKYKAENEARIKAQEEAFKKQLEDALAVKKGVARNDSPFNNDNKNIVRLPDGKEIDVTQLNHDEIEERSRIAFMQAFGIRDPNFGKPLVRYK